MIDRQIERGQGKGTIRQGGVSHTESSRHTDRRVDRERQTDMNLDSESLTE